MRFIDKVVRDEEISSFITASGEALKAMQYTEHGKRHASYVSSTAGRILRELGYSEKDIDLARVAGYVHDIGNSINRRDHGVTSATLVYPILKRIGMSTDDAIKVITAIGNHEEEIGSIVSDITAALVIADKSDAHRTRVIRDKFDHEDIHDRVNFSIRKSFVRVDKANKVIESKIYMDSSSSVMDYLKIYLKRIVMSEKAAHFLGCEFALMINDVRINSPKRMTKTKLQQIIDEIDKTEQAE